jgi:hypothetical protein
MFTDINELNDYIRKTKGKRATSLSPLYSTNNYNPCSKNQLRQLTSGEVQQYLKEQKEQSKEWCHIVAC